MNNRSSIFENQVSKPVKLTRQEVHQNHQACIECYNDYYVRPLSILLEVSTCNMALMLTLSHKRLLSYPVGASLTPAIAFHVHSRPSFDVPRKTANS